MAVVAVSSGVSDANQWNIKSRRPGLLRIDQGYINCGVQGIFENHRKRDQAIKEQFGQKKTRDQVGRSNRLTMEQVIEKKSNRGVSVVE